MTVVDFEGYSALDVAARHGDAGSELVERILNCRPPPPLNSTAADGLRPLQRCISQAAPKLTALLLAAGASPQGAVLELLTRAAGSGKAPNWDLVLVLVGADVSLHGAEVSHGESALVLAARMGAPRAVMRALPSAPGTVVEMYGTKGESALMAALREGHLDTAFELLCVGASVHSAASAILPETATCKGMKEAEGKTPLMYLADVRPPAAVSSLRERPLPDATVPCSHCKKDAADPLRAPVMWVGDGDAPVCASCRIACYIPDIVHALGGGPTAWVEVPVSGHGVPPPPQMTTLPAGEYPTLEAAQIAAAQFAPTCGPLAIWLDTRSPGPAALVLRPAPPTAYPGVAAVAPAGAQAAAAPTTGRSWWAVSAPELTVLDVRSATGRTALHFALERASHALCAETARRLVRCGASVNIASNGGTTAFVRALTLRDAEVDRETAAGGGAAAVVGMRSREVVAVMVDRARAACRGNATELSHWLGLDAVDADGSPLLHALLRCSIPKRASRLAMLLDDCRASADVIYARTGASAMHVAAGETADDVVELIQRLHRASTAPFALLNGVDKAGATPMHLAARVCNVAAVEALATLGARIDTPLPNGTSPFDVAMAGGDAGARVAEKLFRFACAEPDIGGRRLKALWAIALGYQDPVRACLGQSGRRGASEDQADVRRYLLERANGESLLLSAALAMGKRVPPALFESVWKAMIASLTSEELLAELKLRHP
ncbi:MAG: hypothetical protein JSS15_12120, partial [Proteobacteria bacterium]|nr:hypothetical protein [Pseudomonadota bacterium]